MIEPPAARGELQSTARGVPRSVGAWIRAFGVFRLAAIVAAAASLLYLWRDTNGRLLEGSLWQVPLVLMLLVVSLPWRTVSIRTVAAFFFVGFGPLLLLTILSQSLLVASPLERWLQGVSRDLDAAGIGALGNLHSNVWAPLTEEIWKIVPLLMVFLWRASTFRTQAGPLDLAILAGASGAGMGFAEDVLTFGGTFWDVPQNPLLGLGVGTLYVALVVSPFNRVPIEAFPALDLTYQDLVGVLVPSVEELPFGALWAGHGVLPLAFGLALGLAALAARRYRLPLAYLFPVAIVAWATWEHFLGNWYREFTCADAATALCTLARLDLLGGLFPLVVIGGWLYGTIISNRIVSWHRATDPALHVPLRQVAWQAYTPRGLGWPLYLARDLLAYLRLRNRAAFGFFHFVHGSERRQREQSLRLLATRTRALILAERLRNRPVPAVPAPAQAALESLAPLR